MATKIMSIPAKLRHLFRTFHGKIEFNMGVINGFIEDIAQFDYCYNTLNRVFNWFAHMVLEYIGYKPEIPYQTNLLYIFPNKICSSVHTQYSIRGPLSTYVSRGKYHTIITNQNYDSKPNHSIVYDYKALNKLIDDKFIRFVINKLTLIELCVIYIKHHKEKYKDRIKFLNKDIRPYFNII